MTLAQVEREVSIDFGIKEKPLHSILAPTLQHLRSALKSTLLFHLAFLGIIVAELFYLFYHLTFLIQSFVFALNLSLLFVTLFTYLTLRLYIKANKTERLTNLRNQFISTFRSTLESQEGLPEHHMAVTHALRQLANALHGMEYKLIPLPWIFDLIKPLKEKLSAWIFWHDVHQMKELLLQASIEEQIKLVHTHPTNLEVHAELANAYVMLSGLYVDPRTIEGLEEDHWIPPNKYSEDFKQKFRQTAERAIEEFKILNYYAPEDPWVHTQLAYSYHDLQMPKEEVEEYEIIMRLTPHDLDTLFKLGKLYFEQGLNAKGLQVYDKLKKAHHKKAESLIQLYGVTTK